MFTSFSANATDIAWKQASSEFYQIEAIVFTTGANTKSVGVTYPDDVCRDFSNEYLRVPSVIVNGNEVRFRRQCIGYQKALMFAVSQAGKNYMVNEFRSKNTVTMIQGGDKFTFSAKGFSKSFSKPTASMGGL